METIVKILDITQITPNVKAFRIEKPDGYQFTPGQATDVSVNEDGWKKEKRPFTFTALNERPYLEFTIKGYFDHDGVTQKIHSLVPGDELIIRDVWGAIAYKGEGYFIAGGAGITPFVAILRQLYKDDKLTGNQLFFSNKTEQDIIYHDELDKMLGQNVQYLLSEQDSSNFHSGKIDRDYLTKHVKDFTKAFYVCGPDEMVKELTDILTELGAKPDTVVFEK
jgi:ferredoxin-NADP reductase